MLQRAIFFTAMCVASVRIFAAEPATIDEQIHDRAKALVGNSLMFGVAVGVVYGDKTYEVFAGQKSFGGAAPDENTIFEIGSVTKTFTTLLLAEAVVKGELQLEQPVAELLGPNVVVPKYGDDEIRLVDLATQTSGLPRIPSNLSTLKNISNPYADYTGEDLEKFLADHQLKHKPGTEFWYSNLGMGLLGYALAKHAGKPYEELVEEEICQPLQMHDTGMTLSEEQQARMASGIAMWGLPTKAWDFADGIPGCGAIRSTLHDMLIYVRANLSPDSTPLTKAIELAHQPRFTVREATEKNPSKREIGLAWLITTDRGKTIVWHNGMTGGYAAFVAMVPAEQLGIVVLANQATSDVDKFGNDLLKDLLDGKLKFDSAPAADAQSPH